MTIRLFWNEIKFKIPEKPLNLEAELKKLEKTNFQYGKNNHFLIWSYDFEEIQIDYRCIQQGVFTIYFTEESVNKFIDNIKDKKITKEQFFNAYKNVFGGKTNE